MSATPYRAPALPFLPLLVLLAMPALHVLTACQNSGSVIQPRTFDRPERVAFACYDRANLQFVPVAGCNDVVLDRDSEDFALIALVTQTAQGELAAVDLDRRLVLDADVRVPGFTFVLVGENPTAVVVPALTARHAYVANQTSRTISWLPLAQFHPDATPTADVGGELALPGAPSDMVLSPDEAFLYVTFPESGTIGEIAVDSSNPTEPLTFVREISLDVTVPAPVAEVAGDAPYQRYCPEGFGANIGRPVIGAPRVATQLGATARPVQLVVDTVANPPVLLVADANLPMIHRLVLDDAGADPALLPALAPAVPTREVVITPPVPTAMGERAATQRYLYAIDALDNSVLAMDYTDTSVNFGAVLAVSTGHEANDRIATRAGVGRLRVVAPSYSVSGGMAPVECDPSDSSQAEDAQPAQLRGVFLLAGQIDGNLAIVDVYDLDAPCRGGIGCDDPAVTNDVQVRIERHRPRIGAVVADEPSLLGFPVLTFDGSAGQIQENGIATTEAVPRLEPFTSCPTGMVRAFPESGTAIVCVSADPWSSPSQTWVADWQAQLPFAVGAGRFDASDGTLFTGADGNFCSWGVLGEDDVVASALSADDPLAGYVGDRLLFTGVLSPSIQAALRETDSEFERCRPFLDEVERDPVYLEIVEAREGELVLRLPVLRNNAGEPIDGPAPVAYTLADVQACFPGVTPFAVHARSAYVVRSTFASYLHRVISVGGSCRVDTSLPFDPADPQTRVEGRAFVGRPYINPYVAFHIGARRMDGNALASMEGITSTLTLATRLLPPIALVDLGRIVSDVTLTPNGQDMIVLDSAASSLAQYALDPLTRITTVQ